MSLYETLDVQVTLRCNFHCANCIKFSNMEKPTGLDYSNTDMGVDQIWLLREEIEELHNKVTESPVIGILCFTGGEPTLHPHLIEMVRTMEPLVGSAVGSITINSNLLIDIPQLRQYIVNYTPTDQKHAVHNTVLLHPTEFGTKTMNTFKGCNHYRKYRPILNVYGYSLCCAADGYIRLFGLNELVIPRLPRNYDGFPLDKMDLVCNHCPFGSATEVFERDAGRPVSQLYQIEAAKNRAGRELKRQYTRAMLTAGVASKSPTSLSKGRKA